MSISSVLLKALVGGLAVVGFSLIGHGLFKASVFDFFDGWLD